MDLGIGRVDPGRGGVMRGVVLAVGKFFGAARNQHVGRRYLSRGTTRLGRRVLDLGQPERNWNVCRGCGGRGRDRVLD